MSPRPAQSGARRRVRRLERCRRRRQRRRRTPRTDLGCRTVRRTRLRGVLRLPVNRPQVRLVDGVTREIDWPATRLSVCSPPGSDRDIVLLRGIEPNMRWRSFCDAILELVEEIGAHTVVILGALLAAPRTPGPSPSPAPLQRRRRQEVQPRKIPLRRTHRHHRGVLQDACVRAGIPPPCRSGRPSPPTTCPSRRTPKATVALLRRVEDVLDIEVPLGELPPSPRNGNRPSPR